MSNGEGQVTWIGKWLRSPSLKVAVNVSCWGKHLRVHFILIRRNYGGLTRIVILLISECKILKEYLKINQYSVSDVWCLVGFIVWWNSFSLKGICQKWLLLENSVLVNLGFSSENLSKVEFSILLVFFSLDFLPSKQILIVSCWR